MVNPALLNLALWDRLSESECEGVARGLAVARFEIVRATRCSQGDATRCVVFFRYADGAEFALVPGGTVTLGLDPGTGLNLDDAGRKSWAQTVSNFGFPPFEEHVRQVMLPLRTVTLAPLLVELTAKGLDPSIAKGGHHGLLSALRKDGFRLLTSDEWEHACAAGTRTPWRWGATCPTDEEPYGDVRFPELKKPNAFGLSIAQNPYDWEHTMESNRMRGGDGGEAVCGGYGYVAEWLTCASAYLWPWFDTNPYSAEAFDQGVVRRVVPLT